jgi:hypothetical protein
MSRYCTVRLMEGEVDDRYYFHGKNVEGRKLRG